MGRKCSRIVSHHEILPNSSCFIEIISQQSLFIENWWNFHSYNLGIFLLLLIFYCSPWVYPDIFILYLLISNWFKFQIDQLLFSIVEVEVLGKHSTKSIAGNSQFGKNLYIVYRFYLQVQLFLPTWTLIFFISLLKWKWKMIFLSLLSIFFQLVINIITCQNRDISYDFPYILLVWTPVKDFRNTCLVKTAVCFLWKYWNSDYNFFLVSTDISN